MKYLIAITTSLIFASCGNIKPLPTDGWSTKGNYVLYQNDTVAELRATELSIDNNKWVREMTFQLTSMKHADRAKELLWYVHTIHPKCEVELDLPMDQFLPMD